MARPVGGVRVRSATGLLLVLLVAGALRGRQLTGSAGLIDEDLYTVADLKLDRP